MSIRVQSLVWDGAPYRGGALLVLLAMADWAGDDGGNIYPTVKTLAHKARLSVRQTQEILRDLESDGTIVKTRTASGSPGKGNHYKIVLERVRKPHPLDMMTGEESAKDGCGGSRRGVRFPASHKDNRQNPSEEPSHIESSTAEQRRQGGLGSDASPAVQERVGRVDFGDRAFEQFLAAYEPAPDADLTAARRAWSTVQQELPSVDALLVCVAAYKAWVNQQNAGRRGALRQETSPAGFLNKRVWKKYTAFVRPNQIGSWPNWGHEADGYIARTIGEAAFLRWFSETRLEIGPPYRLIVNGEFRARWIEDHYRSDIARAFGGAEVQVVVAPVSSEGAA